MCGWMATGTPQTIDMPGTTDTTRGLLLKARRGLARATKDNSFTRGIGPAAIAGSSTIMAGTGIKGTAIITGIRTTVRSGFAATATDRIGSRDQVRSDHRRAGSSDPPVPTIHPRPCHPTCITLPSSTSMGTVRWPPERARMRLNASLSDSTSYSTNSVPFHSSDSLISRVKGQLAPPNNSTLATAVHL
jgi:hypothetical protein